ncbi:hypothetical protein U9M48_029588 [Paspalum notatum var. saurae]|uniref:Retrotransposon gag domain-containing protein n=1 Tax=Paspalum notatum var. saurae TaxID=547442 RepID=A0AAQ3TZ59_PASNO
MALAIRLLGRRRLLPPPLAAAVAHLSAASESSSHHHRRPIATPTLPLSLRELPPFALHSRCFSWYSRSGSGPKPSPGTAAADVPREDAYTEKESMYLDGVHIVDDEEDVASWAGAAADAVGGATGATADGVGGVTELAVSTVSNLMDGLHSLTGLPWWITISFSTVAMRLLILPALMVQLQKTAKIDEILRKLSTSSHRPQPGSNFHEQFVLFQKKKKELGCPSFLWNFTYFSVQFPCFIIWMMSVRSMCLNNHPGFDNVCSSLRPRGITSPEKTDRDYELRSRGPVIRGFDALDNLVSRSRRSSSSSAPSPRPSTTTSASSPSPPPSPPSAAASVTSAMSEPTSADLAKMIAALTTSVTNLQTTVAALQKEKSASSSSSGGGNDDQHHNDRPPRFQKMDFPRYDGKSDPLIFINRCESYFHQYRIMEEEKVWMASNNLEDGAQLWYIQVQADEGTPSWRRFTELLNLRYGPPLRSAPLFELADCRRTGTVEEYQDRFQALLPRAGRLGEAQRVQLFTGGLLPPLSHDVRVHNP